MRRILIRGARQLLTLRGSHGPRRGPALRQLSIIEDGSVLIDRGIIREIGPTRRVENLLAARGAVEIDASGMVVMPGFVDCHAHLPGTEVSFGGGTPIDKTLALAEAVRTTPASRLQADHAETLRRCAEHGTTTMGVLAGFGFGESTDAKALRTAFAIPESPVRVIPSWYGLQLVDTAGPEREREQAARAFGITLPALLRRHALARVHAACGSGSFSAVECARFITTARTLGLQARLDFASYGRKDGLREVLDAHPWTVDHLEFAQQDDLRALAECDSMAVLLPSLAFAQQWDHTAAGRELADIGTPIALGTDFRPGVVNGSSMQFVIYLACRIMKLALEEAIVAATINAAHALGLADQVGSIEPGKQADLILLRTPGYNALGCEFGVNLVEMTIHSGEIVSRRAGD